jgi:hypothetical protein
MHAIYPKQLIPELDADPASPAVGEMWIKITVLDPAGSLQTTALMGLLLNDDSLNNATVKIKTSVGVINLGTII